MHSSLFCACLCLFWDGEIYFCEKNDRMGYVRYIQNLTYTMEPLIKDTPYKGHNGIHLNSKDTVCGPKGLFCVPTIHL